MLDRISVDLSPIQLEVQTRRTLDDLLGARGLVVKHNGTASSHAPGGKPDIEMWNPDVHITVEVTKLRRVAQSNAEATPVTAHLDDVVASNPGKTCYSLFISPATFERTVDLFANYNHRYADEPDRKIACLNFNTFNLLCEWLSQAEQSDVTVADVIELIKGMSAVTGDDEVLAFLNDECFKVPEIGQEIRREQRDRLAEKYTSLGSVFNAIHKDLRSVSGLGPPEAFHELSKLVFLKMYEEQAVEEESAKGRIAQNRFTTAHIQTERARRRPRGARHPIIELFDEVRSEFEDEGLFEPGEQITIDADRDAGSLIDSIVARIEDFSFIDPEVPVADIKGMIYEQFLGLSLRNTDLGQYFTPDTIIDFMIQIADLKPTSKVMDPACGTGRFLVHAMNKMVGDATSPQQISTIKAARLIGNELSPYVAKIAKMNMYVHGDGRTNIYRRDTLAHSPDASERVDVILTNPPLGEINFGKIFGSYDESTEWYESMEIIEKRVTTPKRSAPKTFVSFSNMKGGALFINRFQFLLKPGGKALTVIDEAVLSTDELKATREFMRRHFDIEAVISLTDDTFKHASQTATKTSILVIRKRKRGEPVQPHPVFYAHASQIGISSKGRQCPNDLIDEGRPDDILRAYGRFLEAIANASKSGSFDPKEFEFEPGQIPGARRDSVSEFDYLAVPPQELGDRLEFKWHDPSLQPIIDQLASRPTVTLASIADKDSTNYGLTATGLEEGDVQFVNIENLNADGTIDITGIRYINLNDTKVADKDYVEVGDILISRSRLPGIASVVDTAEAGLIFGSYIIRFRLSEEGRADYLPKYVALFINSVFGQSQVYRLKSGSNGFNINIPQLEAIAIPILSVDDQAELVRTAALQRTASQQLSRLVRRFQDVADWTVISACLGEESAVDFDEIVSGLGERLEPVDRFLGEAAVAPDGLAALDSVRKGMKIRPSHERSLGSDATPGG